MIEKLHNKWINKISRTIRYNGLGIALYKVLSVSLAVLFDMYYGIDTETRTPMKNIAVIGENRIYGKDYSPVPFLPTLTIFRKIKNYIPENCTFIDYGCGKGRVLLIAADYGIKSIKGIDFSPDLCRIARYNINKYIHKTGKIIKSQVIDSDALDYPISPEDNLIFLFNPFHSEVFDKLLDNIEKSLARNPRYLMIIYVNPRHADLIEKRTFCKTKQEYEFGSCIIDVFLNEVRQIP